VGGLWTRSKTATGAWVKVPYTIDARRYDPIFEVVRYDSGPGRVYHLPSEHIAVEGAHLVGDAGQLVADLDAWMADPQHRTISYSGGSRHVLDEAW